MGILALAPALALTGLWPGELHPLSALPRWLPLLGEAAGLWKTHLASCERDHGGLGAAGSQGWWGLWAKKGHVGTREAGAPRLEATAGAPERSH